MKSYRIRVMNDKGMVVFQMPFETKEDWDNYWKMNLMTESGLAIFTQYKNVVVLKEYLTQGGNWETEYASPVELTE